MVSTSPAGCHSQDCQLAAGQATRCQADLPLLHDHQQQPRLQASCLRVLAACLQQLHLYRAAPARQHEGCCCRPALAAPVGAVGPSECAAGPGAAHAARPGCAQRSRWVGCSPPHAHTRTSCTCRAVAAMGGGVRAGLYSRHAAQHTVRICFTGATVVCSWHMLAAAKGMPTTQQSCSAGHTMSTWPAPLATLPTCLGAARTQRCCTMQAKQIAVETRYVISNTQQHNMADSTRVGHQHWLYLGVRPAWLCRQGHPGILFGCIIQAVSQQSVAQITGMQHPAASRRCVEVVPTCGYSCSSPAWGRSSSAKGSQIHTSYTQAASFCEQQHCNK